MKRQKTLLSPGGWTALLLLLALGLWEATAAAGYVDPFFFSRPSLLWQEFWTMLHSGMLARHLSVTAQEAGLGLLLGGTLGTLAGLGLGLSPPGQPGPDAPDDRPQRTAQAGSGAAVYHLVRDGPFLQGPDLGPDGLFYFCLQPLHRRPECGPRLGGGGAPAGRHPGTDPGKGHLARLPALAAHQSPHRSGPVPVRRHCGEYLGSTRGMGWLLSAAGMCSTPSGSSAAC